VARLAGDEFVILLEDMKEDQNANTVADKILDALRHRLELDGRNISARTSVGVAYGAAGEDAEALLKRADKALYEAKIAGRDRYRVAAPALNRYADKAQATLRDG